MASQQSARTELRALHPRSARGHATRGREPPGDARGTAAGRPRDGGPGTISRVGIRPHSTAVTTRCCGGESIERNFPKEEQHAYEEQHRN